MNVNEKSDIGVEPEKEPNKVAITRHGGGSGGKAGDRGEYLSRLSANCTQRQGVALHGLDRIREAAARDKNLRFTNLMHHITVDLLRDAYQTLKRDSAAGVDEVTWHEYGEGLENRLEDLQGRVQSGKYPR